jgi:quinohemoprotein ethanol dehydrogenase
MRWSDAETILWQTALFAVLALTLTSQSALSTGDVDPSRLRGADTEPQNWFTLGRDQNQTYYSPLAEIDASNVGRVGFAWAYDLGTARGQEATPIVIDGTMCTSGTWGYVYALDAATGEELWKFDPRADPRAARNPCCDLVNRGVAVWKGKVFVASVDGRLHALDAKTGTELWNADTIEDHKLSYSSTGAVYIAGDLAVIGNSGADMDKGGVRGYVSAYEVETGSLAWRLYTVPGAPGQVPEDPAIALAMKTWNPHRAPEYKGGGTVWDGFAYDPALQLIYFGTGNAAPYDLRLLGGKPKDALFAASIVALHADTGHLAWYYQTPPGGGSTRPVILQANKNGFFYVLDRRTGKLVSAKNFTFVNWASSIDMKTGRPHLTKQANWYSGPKIVYPSWAGGHSWPPMSFNPRTSLVYIPAIDVPSVWVDLLHNGGRIKFVDSFFTAIGVFPDETYNAAALKRYYGRLPDLKTLEGTRKVKLLREFIRAWDPITQKMVWEHETTSGVCGYDGGVMSTAGNLVFQGRGNGELWVYAADSGKVLKTIQTGSHIMAAPVTYAVDGVQYVAVQVGYGGTGIGVGSIPPTSAALKYENANRIVAFKLDGGDVPKPMVRKDEPFPKPPANEASPTEIQAGETKFIEQCSRCHALGPNITPDLRKMPQQAHDMFKDILLGGAFARRGMESFIDVLSDKEVENIHAYLIEQSWQAYRQHQAPDAERTPMTAPNTNDADPH